MHNIYTFPLLLHFTSSLPFISPSLLSVLGVILSTGSITYQIVPLGQDSPTPSSSSSSSTITVTMLWLERCLESETLLDPSSHFLFSPLPCTIQDNILCGCVLTIRYSEGKKHVLHVCVCVCVYGGRGCNGKCSQEN